VEFLDLPQAAAQSTARRSAMISCPRTGNNTSTGIRLTVPDKLKKMSSARRFTQCPYCKVVHGWTPSDAFLEPAPL
jgi:hypothetical protein